MITDFTLKIAGALWELQSSITSLVLFGEYPYPAEENYE